MSLINDALKRAQETHDKQAQPLPGSAPLHVAPPPPPSRLWPVAVVCLVLAVVLSAGGIWYLRKSQPHLFQSVQQAMQGGKSPPAPAAPQSGIIIIQPGQKIPGPPPVDNPLPPVQPAPAAAPAPAKPAAVKPAPAPVVPPAPAPAVVENHPPVSTSPPPNTRLQGILYRPDHPAAIINGRTVYVGDPVGDGVVQSITPNNVILLWGGQLFELHL